MKSTPKKKKKNGNERREGKQKPKVMNEHKKN